MGTAVRQAFGDGRDCAVHSSHARHASLAFRVRGGKDCAAHDASASDYLSMMVGSALACTTVKEAGVHANEKNDAADSAHSRKEQLHDGWEDWRVVEDCEFEEFL